MTHPHIPPQPGGPGAYEAQTATQRNNLTDLLRAAEDELAQRRQAAEKIRALHYPEGSMWDGLQCYLCGGPNYPCDTVKALGNEPVATPVMVAQRYRLAWQSARRRADRTAEILAAFHEGEEPPPLTVSIEVDGEWKPVPGITAATINRDEPKTGTAYDQTLRQLLAHRWSWWDEEAQQVERAKAILADYLATNPVPGVDGVPYRSDVDRLSPVALAEQVHRARLLAEADYIANSLIFGPTAAEPEATNPGMSWNSFLSDAARAWRREDAEKLWAGLLGAVPAGPPATADGLAVITTDPVQEIAAEPATLEQLRRQLPTVPASRLAAQVGQIGQYSGFPAVVDADLPPGEVYLRPHQGQPSTEPAKCPPACNDGHMYEARCLLDPRHEPDVIGGNGHEPDLYAWRCWGTDECPGMVSLGHSSPAVARRSYDRHCARYHGKNQA